MVEAPGRFGCCCVSMYHEETEGRALPPQQYHVLRTCVMCEETRKAKRQVRIGVDHATRGSVKFLHTRKTPDVEDVRGPSLDPTAQAGSVADMFLPQAKNLDQYSGTDMARSAHVCALAMCRFTGWTQGAVKCTTFQIASLQRTKKSPCTCGGSDEVASPSTPDGSFR